MCMWFAMIVRVAYKVVSGQGADDSRSDDEDEEEDESLMPEDAIDKLHTCAEPKPVVEQEMLSPDFVKTRSGRSPARKTSRRKDGSGSSSGINVLGASDRKELLGRIGCDKTN